MVKRTLAQLIGLASLCLAGGCEDSSSNDNSSGFSYVEMDKNDHFPTDREHIQTWINNDDRDAIAEHSWELWAGLTKETDEFHNGQPMRVWETWYSPKEVFEEGPDKVDEIRHSATNFSLPGHNFHDEPSNLPSVVAFNKYNHLYADHIWNNQYHEASILDKLNAFFDFSDEPTILREINEFPRDTIAVKPLFEIISQTGLTVIPYWSGPDKAHNLTQPTHKTWTQCIAVDPSGTMAGQNMTVDCNGVSLSVPVMPLDEFYTMRITADDVEDINNLPDTITGNLVTAKEGDYAALVAMHVSTKEIANWTWQTFWFDPYPEAKNHPAMSRPTEVIDRLGKPWSNFSSCQAYSMVSAEASGNENIICFNPYFETGLTSVDGKASNCMTCHALATWGNDGNRLKYQANGHIDRDDIIFSEFTKLDFLWSLTRANKTDTN